MKKIALFISLLAFGTVGLTACGGNNTSSTTSSIVSDTESSSTSTSKNSSSSSSSSYNKSSYSSKGSYSSNSSSSSSDLHGYSQDDPYLKAQDTDGDGKISEEQWNEAFANYVNDVMDEYGVDTFDELMEVYDQ